MFPVLSAADGVNVLSSSLVITDDTHVERSQITNTSKVKTDALLDERLCHCNSTEEASLVQHWLVVVDTLIVQQEILTLLDKGHRLLVGVVSFLAAVLHDYSKFDLALECVECGALADIIFKAQVDDCLDVFTFVTFLVFFGVI